MHPRGRASLGWDLFVTVPQSSECNALYSQSQSQGNATPTRFEWKGKITYKTSAALRRPVKALWWEASGFGIKTPRVFATSTDRTFIYGCKNICFPSYQAKCWGKKNLCCHRRTLECMNKCLWRSLYGDGFPGNDCPTILCRIEIDICWPAIKNLPHIWGSG